MSEVGHCVVCGKEVLVMCFLGTGVCSENCRKARNKGESNGEA